MVPYVVSINMDMYDIFHRPDEAMLSNKGWLSKTTKWKKCSGDKNHPKNPFNFTEIMYKSSHRLQINSQKSLKKSLPDYKKISHLNHW